MRCFIYLSYDGTPFHGWQVQPNGTSVQGELQRALSLLLHEPTDVVGAGRTDAGVHAKLMVAHCDIPDSTDLHQLTYRLNGILPSEIAIDHIEQVADDAHARFSATSRTYHYYIHTAKSPFLRNYSWRLAHQPDIEAMNAAAATLTEYTDFTSFSKVNTDTKTNICHIDHARWEQTGPHEWRFEIQADRFLRNMVRAIVGTLMLVGRHEIDIDGFRRIIEAKDRSVAGESVPARGLFLVDVGYICG
ncbi:MAG: tRNA pseudouridine(38-40) synthase TruA [Bacteroidaceae bacterium]|nr:tRNA pseudouridine(38-40) synthase TruA [Bacteroidaceae bacterium]